MRQQLCNLAREAGDAIMNIYNGHAPLQVEHKQDDSPVTAADIAAHQIINAGLLRLTRIFPSFLKRIHRNGRYVATGNVIGLLTLLMEQKSLLIVMAISRSILL